MTAAERVDSALDRYGYRRAWDGNPGVDANGVFLEPEKKRRYDFRDLKPKSVSTRASRCIGGKDVEIGEEEWRYRSR